MSRGEGAAFLEVEVAMGVLVGVAAFCLIKPGLLTAALALPLLGAVVAW